jgi:hypothetical protein
MREKEIGAVCVDRKREVCERDTNQVPISSQVLQVELLQKYSQQSHQRIMKN